MNDIGIPGIPFATSAPKSGPPNIIDFLNAGQARGLIESGERDSEKREREAAEAVAHEQAVRAELERSWVDYYDGIAKVERSRGNRKFVRHFAIGAGVTIAGILVIEALIAHAGGRQ